MISDGNIFSKEEENILKNKRFTILGLGGLGSISASMLVRAGVENITIVDYDTFDSTNINRQIYANTKTVAHKKTDVTCNELKKINPNLNIILFDKKLDIGNAKKIIDKSDIVLDGFDNIESRIVALNVCKELGIPFVFAAVGGFLGYVSIITNGENNNIVDIINKKIKQTKAADTNTFSFTVATVSSIQVSESIKFVLGMENTILDKLIAIDLLKPNIDILNIKYYNN